MKILLIGDVMLGRLVNETLSEESPEYPWGDTLPLIRSADISLCNLECVLSDNGTPAPKTFTFRSDAKNVAVLKVAGIKAVSLANNHVLDFGPKALIEMLDILDTHGIAHAGAGRSLAQAMALATVNWKGQTVGLLAATDTEEVGWAATKDRPGIWYVPIDPLDNRARLLFDAVSEAAQRVDFLIVSLHWGSNWGEKPERGHRNFAHTLIQAGADLVFGHSAHITRGIEIYNGSPILYSAGDFVDDYAVNELERNDESAIFFAQVTAGRVRQLSIYPSIIENCQARLPDPVRALKIASRLSRLSHQLGTKIRWSHTKGALHVQL